MLYDPMNAMIPYLGAFSLWSPTIDSNRPARETMPLHDFNPFFLGLAPDIQLGQEESKIPLAFPDFRHSTAPG